MFVKVDRSLLFLTTKCVLSRIEPHLAIIVTEEVTQRTANMNFTNFDQKFEYAISKYTCDHESPGVTWEAVNSLTKEQCMLALGWCSTRACTIGRTPGCTVGMFAVGVSRNLISFFRGLLKFCSRGIFLRVQVQFLRERYSRAPKYMRGMLRVTTRPIA